MPSDMGEEERGTEDRNDGVARLSRIGSRAGMAAIDATLRVLARHSSAHAAAAAELHLIARRTVRTARDLAASMSDMR